MLRDNDLQWTCDQFQGFCKLTDDRVWVQLKEVVRSAARCTVTKDNKPLSWGLRLERENSVAKRLLEKNGVT